MKDKSKKKKITMEDLAGMVQRGFLSVEKKMAKQVDLDAVKTDVADLKIDVATLKVDVIVMKEDITALKTDVADLKENFHKILDSLDKVAKQYADYLEERKMRDAEIARLKRWVEQIAQKVGVQLTD